MNIEQNEKHTLLQSIVLHLLPGILIGGFYFLVRQPVMNMGYPSILALALAIPFVLIPAELGFLFYQAKKKTGRYDLRGIIAYRSAIPWWQYILWSLIIFGVIGLIMTVLKPVEVFLHENLFYWVPQMDGGLDGNYAKSSLIVTYATSFIFVVVAGPLVEELYFRGYLLPRMQGKFAALTESFLFALYHTFTPWLLVSRTIGFLPLLYAVKKKNIYLGMIIHILCNTVDVITAVVFIMAM